MGGNGSKNEEINTIKEEEMDENEMSSKDII